MKNITVQGVPESMDPDYADCDILEYKLTLQILKLMNKMAQQVMKRGF